MKLLPLILAVFLTACVDAVPTAPPSSYLASNLISARAVPGSISDFEVLPKRGAGAFHYWCAAGEYVVKGMRRPGTTRVYLSEVDGVLRFTISPDAALVALGAEKPETDYSVRLKPGENYRAGHFGRPCDPVLVPFWF